MRLKVVRLRDSTTKKFRDVKTTEVKEAIWGPDTAQEAHDRLVNAGKLHPESVPLQPIRERWWRKVVSGLTNSWRQ